MSLINHRQIAGTRESATGPLCPQAQNKPSGTNILVSEDVWVEAGMELEVDSEAIKDVQLSGRREKVTLFQLK